MDSGCDMIAERPTMVLIVTKHGVMPLDRLGIYISTMVASRDGGRMIKSQLIKQSNSNNIYKVFIRHHPMHD